MAIQNRRGKYSDYDPSKLMPGEWAVVQSGDTNTGDGKAVYIAFGDGTVKRMASADEMEEKNQEAKEFMESAEKAALDAEESYEGARKTALSIANNEQQFIEEMQELVSKGISAISDEKELSVKAVEDAAQAAESVISNTYTENMSAIETAKTFAIQEINEKKKEVDEKADQIARVTTEADQVAAQALSTANNAENHMATLDSQMKELEAAMQDVSIDPDDLGLEQDPDTYYVYPTYKGVRSENGIPLAGGSGGGGWGGETINAKFNAENISGWISTTIATGSSLTASVRWSSIEDGMETGDGNLQIKVNDIVRASYQVPQGDVLIDLTPYLSAGANKVKIRVSDTYDQAKTMTFNITAETLTISSSFDTSQTYDSVIRFPYIPVGAVQKTVHFELDGREFDPYTTSVSNRQMTYTIPAQSHGAHSLRVWFEAEINGQIVRSNELYFEFTCVEALGTDPVIASSYNQSTVRQYTAVTVPFSVYDPSNLTAEVRIYANNTLVSTQTVDRNEHTYTYKANTAGALTIRLVSGTAEKIIDITVTESDVEIQAEADSLTLHLTAEGRSNNEEHPESWTSDAGDISASLTGFNWASDGWQRDDDGNVCLRVAGDARVTIPYQLFGSDARQTGLTFEVEYATRNVSDYNATVLSCMSGNRGIEITPQTAVLKSEQTELSMQFGEGEHIRIAYTIDKRSENRLLRSYIDGKPCRAAHYPDDDDFSQITPVGISVGSNDCTIDIYCIRVYANNLTRHQILNNWIADTQDGTEMLNRYTRNQVYDEYGNVVIAQLPSDLPYMVIEAEELPDFKGDKKIVSGSYTDPLRPAKSFLFAGMQINIQGTSSAPYYRKNYDMQFKNGFEMVTSGHSDTFKLRDDSIPTARFVAKANVASSEMANNTELVRLYNDTCPYKTPEMEADSRVRWGIDGYPIVIFWHDVVSGVTKFLGNYDFNFPKRFPEGYGYTA